MTVHASPPPILDAAGVEAAEALSILKTALAGADDGELFLERSESESLVFDDGRLKSAAYDASEGFGLRVVAGETAGYAHANEISAAALRRAADSAALAKQGHAGVAAEAPRATNQKLYGEVDPLASPAFSDKIALLAEIDAWARARDPRVVQVSASLVGERRAIEILRADDRMVRDIRPLVRLNVSVTVEQDGRRESASSGAGGRAGFETWVAPERWQAQVDEALRQALVNLDAIDAPAGVMPVVLGAGWPGVLLHEAIGHGFEGDFHRKGSSVFNGMMGKRVAAPGVTVVDASTGGLGGCPYAKSATGNLATEDLVWMLDGAGVETGVDLDALVETSAWMAQQLGKGSRVVTVICDGATPAAAALSARRASTSRTSRTTSPPWSAAPEADSKRSARQCIRHTGSPVSAITRYMSGSASPPETSLIMSTPASAAAKAVAARIVSTEVRIPSACRCSMTGRTRSASTSAGTRTAPGRVDSAPTSMMSAPRATSVRA